MNRKIIWYQGRKYIRRQDKTTDRNRPVLTVLVNLKTPGSFLGRLVSERSHYGAPYRLLPGDSGCYVDGHWGQYGIAHMITRAEDMGYNDAEVIRIADKHLASMITWGSAGKEPLTDDEYEIMLCSSDEVEEWLNENVAPEGYSFGWWDGEFFLWSDEQWEEGC